MSQNKKELSANDAWKDIIEKYNIITEIEKNGKFHIKANQIKEFKEPRLMAKWDSSSSLPEVFKKNRINILSDSRSSYVIGDFILYEEIPELNEHVTQMDSVVLPEYESIDVNNISTEANAINVLVISGILEDFLSSNKNVATFNGRMGTGVFDFKVNTFRGVKQGVRVSNAQCEIDGGFENDESVVIMEAKNAVHEDFHIRQLYYPYRLWRTKVRKPIRLIFSVYSNMIYRLFEYRFNDLNDFSSIELVKSKNYSLQDTTITIDDLKRIRNTTRVTTDDNMNNTDIPFIQANSMDRIISMLENMYNNPLTNQQIADLMNFELRQADYYFNAGRYIGVFKKDNNGENQKILTTLGENIFKLNYKDRQLKLVELLLKHQIFADVFDCVIDSGEFPSVPEISNYMKKYNVCGYCQIHRRASSVLGWLRWVFTLTKL